MISCPLCAYILHPNTNRDIFNPYGIEYKLYHCPECSLEFWYPPKIIDEYYSNEKFSGYGSYHMGKRLLPWYCKHPFSVLKKRKINGDLLDIGCGDGIFLKKLQCLNLNLYGIDLDRESVACANEVYGIKSVYAARLEIFVSTVFQKFDVVTFFEVVEHQENLDQFLIDVKKLLKANGLIFGSVPNRERLFHTLKQRRGDGDFPPHHFFWFSREVIAFLLHKHGFTNISFYSSMPPLSEYAVYLETALLGWLTCHIKKIIKKKFSSSMHNYIEANQRRWYQHTIFISAIHSIRVLVFLPLAIFLWPLMKRRGGMSINFEATLPITQKT